MWTDGCVERSAALCRLQLGVFETSNAQNATPAPTILLDILSALVVWSMNLWMGGWVDGLMDGWMDARKEGRMDGWMDGRMDGWMDERGESVREMARLRDKVER